MTDTVSQIRIIGGQWRSRKICFPCQADLRPSSDRTRETLFNWLSPYIKGANCLDLFAGTGALGFEAASRGAKNVVLLEKSPNILHYLQQNLNKLQADHVQIYQYEIPKQHIDFKHVFDIVFIDPPFHQDLIATCTTWLEQQKCLSQDALIYLETEKTLTPLPVPEHWQILRQKKTKHTRYYLLQRGQVLRATA